ncbi:hypothetical protein QUB60_25875 [Microcoleus sp. A2-C5]
MGRKKEEGRRKKEEGRRKREEGREKKEETRGKPKGFAQGKKRVKIAICLSVISEMSA